MHWESSMTWTDRSQDGDHKIGLTSLRHQAEMKAPFHPESLSRAPYFSSAPIKPSGSPQIPNWFEACQVKHTPSRSHLRRFHGNCQRISTMLASKVITFSLFQQKKGNNRNYIRCCECKIFLTWAAVQRLMLHLLAFSLPVVHLYLNISQTEYISINTVMRWSISGNSTTCTRCISDFAAILWKGVKDTSSGVF